VLSCRTRAPNTRSSWSDKGIATPSFVNRSLALALSQLHRCNQTATNDTYGAVGRSWGEGATELRQCPSPLRRVVLGVGDGNEDRVVYGEPAKRRCRWGGGLGGGAPGEGGAVRRTTGACRSRWIQRRLRRDKRRGPGPKSGASSGCMPIPSEPVVLGSTRPLCGAASTKSTRIGRRIHPGRARGPEALCIARRRDYRSGGPPGGRWNGTYRSGPPLVLDAMSGFLQGTNGVVTLHPGH
jgi:hypothetical protein